MKVDVNFDEVLRRLADKGYDNYDNDTLIASLKARWGGFDSYGLPLSLSALPYFMHRYGQPNDTLNVPEKRIAAWLFPVESLPGTFFRISVGANGLEVYHVWQRGEVVIPEGVTEEQWENMVYESVVAQFIEWLRPVFLRDQPFNVLGLVGTWDDRFDEPAPNYYESKALAEDMAV
jgi:hypothetical protein